MKCENCRKRMKVIPGNTDIQIENAYVKVINIPVFVCSNCEKQVMHDILIERAMNYVHLYGTQHNIIDFGKCEQKENEDAMVVMQTLGIL